jgi:hypothetical protein
VAAGQGSADPEQSDTGWSGKNAVLISPPLGSVPVASAEPRQRYPQVRARLGPLASRPAWPVTILLVGYPVWWALGLADFMWMILAVPMVARMIAWHTRGGRRIRVPPGFGLWLMFLVVVAVGLATITLTAPGTVPSAVSHRLLSYADRTLGYAGVTVLLLYAGNLTERELPRRALAWMLGLVGLYTIAGGLAGIAMPHLGFSSPFLLVLPKSVQANSFIQASMHPALTQVQNVLGAPGGRPKAPFDYTNTWGNCLTILLPFLLVGWWWRGSRRSRLIAGSAIVLAIVPLLYSLNRDAWIAVLLSVGYLAVRFAARGKAGLLGALCASIALAGAVVAVTPLSTVITSRIQHGRSNNLRAHLDSLAVTDALASPFIGYGDTRQEAGSAESIAVGPSYKCPSCGQMEVGSTGQLWLLLVCDGIVGAALYLSFFGYGVWRFRRDISPYGLAGVLVLLLTFVFMLAYDATGAPLGFTMLAYALLWKSDALAAPGSPQELAKAAGPPR